MEPLKPKSRDSELGCSQFFKNFEVSSLNDVDIDGAWVTLEAF